jgi:hypothetical protein
MIMRSDPWHTRSTISRWAHVLERTGLALTGAACGLFVAAHVGRAAIDLIGSAAAVLAMMVYGAAGFYLGIDLPPVPPDHRMHLPLRHGLGSSWDTVELLSATGTFLAAVTAFVSVSSIILDETARPSTAHQLRLGGRRHYADCRRNHCANAGKCFRHILGRAPRTHSSVIDGRAPSVELFRQSGGMLLRERSPVNAKGGRPRGLRY